jgi:gamma-glutamylcyclotransferase (GGCT)/AIG2-like uncharacterized protein YtfP
MPEFGFFYGTLMTGFERRNRLGMDTKMSYRGRGWIHAALFDLGLYPAAVPDPDSRVWGEVFELNDPAALLAALDRIEGYTPGDPDTSLYLRRQVRVHLDDDTTADAWVYFYNAPLGHASRIPSGDYLSHLKIR